MENRLRATFLTGEGEGWMDGRFYGIHGCLNMSPFIIRYMPDFFQGHVVN